MALTSDIIARVRTALGDRGVPFSTSVVGDGLTDRYELAASVMSASGLVVTRISNNIPVVLVSGTDYTLDLENAVITLSSFLPLGNTLYIRGTSYSLFSDAELTQNVNDAILQHTSGRTNQYRSKSADGFIVYSEVPITIETLPEIEEQLVAILATIESLWILSTDAASDIDINTAEGTFVPRTQRHIHILQQIDMLTEKYKSLCQQLNVGLYRIEVGTLRRQSRSTNRLVPIYREREYDDNTPPSRILPHVDDRDVDTSGIPSPLWGGW
jgi:hypothetical protein